MADLSTILKDPNFVNANAATKQAIFDKWAPQDPNFANANAATQDAIRAKFGIGQGSVTVEPLQMEEPQSGVTPPKLVVEQPGLLASTAQAVGDVLSAPFEMGASLARKPRKEQVAFVAPAVEALGAAGGAALGTPLGPAAMVGGSGLGYAAAKEALRLAAGTPARQGAAQVIEPLQHVTEGALQAVGGELIGRGVGHAVNYVNKLRNIKADTYLKAIEGMGDDILNALRAPNGGRIVPGSAPTAGEVAAPVGSTGFSALQARFSEIPEIASEYAAMAAQSNKARLDQEARVQSRYQRVIDKATERIKRGLSNTPPEETGRALEAVAKSERESVKSGVIQPAYKAAFDAAGNAKIDMSGVIGEAESILGRKLSTFDPSTAPQTVTKLLSLEQKAAPATPAGKGLVSSKIMVKGAAPPPPEVTLQQLDDVRKAINADIASATRSSDPAAATTLRNLRKLHSKIDEAVASSGNLSQDAKTLYQEALDLYRTEYAPRFKVGVAGDLFKQTASNVGKVKPEDVLPKFFQPKGVSEAEQFVSLFGKRPDAVQIARSGIEDLYLREAGGMVTPKSHADFLRKYADPIRVLDNAGINVTARLNAVAADAARLERVQQLAAASGNKLSPALPAGANALAVESRISDLTRGLSPRQLADVNAVRADLAREGEYERLVKAAGKGGIDPTSLASTAGKESGLPFPSLLSVPITIFNNVYKKLALRMDDKLALEIARELTSPALAAKSIEEAMRTVPRRAAAAEAGRLRGRAVTIGGTIAGTNALAEQ